MFKRALTSSLNSSTVPALPVTWGKTAVSGQTVMFAVVGWLNFMRWRKEGRLNRRIITATAITTAAITTTNSTIQNLVPVCVMTKTWNCNLA